MLLCFVTGMSLIIEYYSNDHTEYFWIFDCCFQRSLLIDFADCSCVQSILKLTYYYLK